MDKSKALNIVLLLVIVVLLLAGKGQEGADTFLKGWISQNFEDDTTATYQKVSFGEKELVYPKPAMVIGTYDSLGKPNIMTAAWFGVVNSKPLKVAVSMRPATYSYHNVMREQAFTVNIPSPELVQYVKYVGHHSGRDVDKFEKTGLTAVRADSVSAPYVQEFPIILECRVTEYFDLGSHRQFVGQVIDAKVDERFVDAAGELDFSEFTPVLYGDMGKYYEGGKEIKFEPLK
ncbi:hypothetical protein PEDI_38840 [Persicobacter diffluens]|uniref:Flavin reductase like domain-containing protein n=2 Tax=Persicobacter diffluens TaxID=981 RepID=A0AAN4W332_9BACT|nr:hypothetical protein PEDI_38840 [Persicobacter diffluens]